MALTHNCLVRACRYNNVQYTGEHNKEAQQKQSYKAVHPLNVHMDDLNGYQQLATNKSSFLF